MCIKQTHFSFFTLFLAFFLFIFRCGCSFAPLSFHSDVTSTLSQTASLHTVSMSAELRLFLSSSLLLFFPSLSLLLSHRQPGFSSVSFLLFYSPFFSKSHLTSHSSLALLCSPPPILSSRHVCQCGCQVALVAVAMARRVDHGGKARWRGRRDRCTEREIAEERWRDI